MKRPQLLLSSCLALALIAAIGTSQTASAAGFITDTIAPTTDLILPFGAVAVGKSSPVHTVTIKNPDPVKNMTVPPLQLPSGSAFILNPNGGNIPCGTGTILSPGASCTFTATFQPTAAVSSSELLIFSSETVEELIAFHNPVTGGISLFGVTSGTKIVDVTLPPTGVEDLNPSWSPGQGQIVFHRHDMVSRSNTILRVNLDGTGETFVANNGTTPAWSPDGQRIVYHNTGQNGGILQVDLNLNKVGEIGNVGTFNPRDPHWSPTGEELVFFFNNNSQPPGHHDIFRVNTDGKGLNLVVRDGGKTPVWSPDGLKIAYQEIPFSQNFIGGGISTINSAGGGTPLPLTTAKTGINDKNPSWSPDGTQIVFHRATETPATDELIVMDSTNGAMNTALTLPEGKTPAWSPSDQVSISFLGTGLAVNTNSPPTAPQLTLPTVNQMNVTVPVTFKWLSSSDPDGDPITYDLLVCPSAVFPTGTCVLKENVGLQSAQKPMTSAGIWLSGGSLLFGIAFSGRKQRRLTTKRMSSWGGFFLLTIMVIGLNACGGGGGGGGGTTITPGGGGAGTTGVGLTHTVENLAPGTSFTWQVTAKDGNGGATPSVARSFTTASIAP